MNILGRLSDKGFQDGGSADLTWGRLRLRLGRHITTVENDRYKLIYEGTIFDRTPEQLLERQQHLDEAYGLFSYVKIDKREPEVVIGADRLGFSPLCYARQGDELLFSSSIVLLKYELTNPSPDFEAWEEILNFDEVLGNKTTVKEISRLPMGTRIHVRGREVRFESFWSPEAPPERDEEGYIERNNELLMEALELTRVAPGPRVVPLSGGMDSRRIAVTAEALGLPMTYATQEAFRHGYDEDVSIAQMVAESLGAKMLRAPLPDAASAYDSALMRDYWFGFETQQHHWLVPLLRRIPGGSLIYDGVAGDVSVNAHVDRKELEHIDTMLNGKRLLFQFEQSPRSTPYERARAALDQLPDCPHRRNYFFLFHHTRRQIGLQAQHYHLMGHRACLPFLYYPLLMQSYSLPPERQIRRLYQSACTAALNPRVAALPSTRETVEQRHRIDFTREAADQDALFAGRARIRPEINELVKGKRTRLLMFQLAAGLRVRGVYSRLNWLAAPLARMSLFLDWLEDRSAPTMPVEPTQPEFLRRRFASKN